MEHVVTYTDIPTILSIKINESIGYVNNVYFRINDIVIGNLEWSGRAILRNGTRYSIFSTNYTFPYCCRNQQLRYTYEVNGSFRITDPIIFDVENFYC